MFLRHRFRWSFVSLFCLLVILSLGLSGCDIGVPTREVEKQRELSKKDDVLHLQAIDFDELPGWDQDRHREVLPAFAKSCGFFLKKPADSLIESMMATFPVSQGTKGGHWHGVCLALERLKAADDFAVRRFFEDRFRPYAVTNAQGEARGLFTGYYEAKLRGARTKSPPYIYPLYKRPHDLVSVDLKDFDNAVSSQTLWGRVEGQRLKPYPDREAIEAGYLKGKGLELLWVDDLADAFFLHVQGSGRVLMDDGSVVRVGYAGKNGHPYRSIGRVLIDQKRINRENVSLQSLRQYMKENPQEVQTLMNRNPSFIFFRELPGEGPIGAQGVALTPMRSLAADRRFIPMGIPVWLDTAYFEPGKKASLNLQRLVIVQDTGSAIKGVVRGDFFWGYGDKAEHNAGSMKTQGRYFLFLPK